MATVEEPRPLPDAHGLPREAGGRQKRLLETQVGLPNSGPPASTWVVSVSLTDTRLGDRACTQRFDNPVLTLP